MDKFYLFGAGINSEAVISYFGSENIIGIIDSNKDIQGKEIKGVRVIDISDYDDKSYIYISSYFQYKAIEKLLDDRKVKNYYRSPYMKTGFFNNPEELIQKLGLDTNDKVAFLGNSPLTQNIRECLLDKYNTVSHVIKIGDELEYGNKLVVADAVDDLQVKEIDDLYGKENVIYVEKQFKERFYFRNYTLEKFKNINCGKRCFIIGNAPSLRYSDLEILRQMGEICFGVNRIYKAFDKTKWKPDYYLAVDSIICENDHDIIEALEMEKFVRYFFGSKDWKSQNLYEFCGISSNEVGFTSDIVKGIYIGNTVIYDAMQIAYYMGFKEIYLLGVDLDFSKKISEQGRHFYKETNKNERLMEGNLDYILHAFKYAADFLEKEGVKLRNLSRAGNWGEIKREDFDDVISSIKNMDD